MSLGDQLPEARLNLALIELRTGREDAAEQDLLRAVELRPDYAKAHFHLARLFRQRDDPTVREAYVQQKEKEADERRRQRGKTRTRRSKAASKKRADLIALETPESVAAGKPLVVKVRHKLEAGLGEQLVHVTLKAGPEGKRLAREVVKVSGDGVAEVTFEVPASVPGNVVRLAAFIGEDYASNMQHLQTAPVPVR